jgi:hypothetical protein
LEIISPKGKRKSPPKHLSPPFKEKEKEGEGRSKAWWLMEGGREGSWFGGQWKEKEKVLGLMANGRRRRRFLVWWPMEGEGEGEGSWLGGQWKEKEKEKILGLVANGRRRRRRRFLAWWPMEGEGEREDSWLGGQWKEKEKEKILGLVANGRRRRRRRFLAWWPMEGEGKGSFLPLPLFPQATLLKPSFFILHIKVLLCPGPRPLFTPSLHFPWPINYDRVS